MHCETPMNCETFESQLNELLDERAPLELDGALAAHARRCGVCRSLLSAYGELARAVRFTPLPKPADDLTDRIVAAARREEPPAPSRASSVFPQRRSAWTLHIRKRLWRVAALAVASAVLLAVAWKFAVPTPDGQASAPAAPRDEASAQPLALSALARDATQSYLKLAHETRQEVADVLLLLPPVEAAPGVSLLDQTLPLEGKPVEIAQRMAESLKPLARSTVDTFGFLFASSRTESGGM
jgi:hypothetical protein